MTTLFLTPRTTHANVRSARRAVVEPQNLPRTSWAPLLPTRVDLSRSTVSTRLCGLDFLGTSKTSVSQPLGCTMWGGPQVNGARRRPRRVYGRLDEQ